MRYIALLALSVVAGCASTPGGLMQSQYSSSFIAEQGYQLSLKRIIDADAECRPVQLLPVGQAINDVQNYPDLKEARITQGASGVGTQIYRVIALKEVDGETTITLYSKGRRDNEISRLRRWVSGGGGCNF